MKIPYGFNALYINLENFEFFSLVELLSEEKEAAVKYQSIPAEVMSIIKL